MNTKRQAMSVDIFNTTVTVTFSNGNSLEIDVATLEPSIQRAAMLHGIKQKLVDSAAMSRDSGDLNSNQVDAKYKAVAEVHARLTGANPSWNKERATAAKPLTGDKVLHAALVQMTGRDDAYVNDFLSAKTKEQRAALKRNPRVLAIIAELSATTVTNGVDSDELLGELGIEETEIAEQFESDEEESAPSTPINVMQAVVDTATKAKRTRKAVAITE